VSETPDINSGSDFAACGGSRGDNAAALPGSTVRGAAAQDDDVDFNGIFDRQAVLDRLLGDMELLGEVIEVFRASNPARVEEIRLALRTGDSLLLQRTAHALKSSVGNFSAGPASVAAARLEALGRDGRVAEAGALADELERELARLQDALDEMMESARGPL